MSERNVEDLAGRLLAKAADKNKKLSKVVVALKKLASMETLDSPRKVSEASRELKSIEPGTLDLQLDFTELFDALSADQTRRAAGRKVEFGRVLTEEAQASGIACELVTADPMEFALPPFTLTADLVENRAALRYARLVLEEIPAKPARIINAHRKNQERLKSGWTPAQFFDALLQAYRAHLLRERNRQDERVRLADLLGSVALAFQGNKFRTDPVAGNYRAYGRVRFAYDLARLRQVGLLLRNGLRLNLGTATGSSTRRKQDVIYIEESVSRGQYYLSVWFTPEGAPGNTGPGKETQPLSISKPLIP